MPTNVELRPEAVNLPETPDLHLKECLAGDGTVTIGPPENRDKSGDPEASSPSRTQSPTNMYSYGFLAMLLLSLVVFRVALSQLAKFSSANAEYSYIPLIPLISTFLILVRRESIFERTKPSLLLGSCIVAGGMLLWFSKDYLWIGSLTNLEFSALGLVGTWCGLFMFWYGPHTARMALLPLCLLLFLVPAPESVLNTVIQFLQRGSAVLSCEMFRLIGVPALREGTVISLPQLTIIVGPECSGIRSSISMLIVTLAIADLYLRCGWTKILLTLLVVPLVVVKNAIRIVTLSILAVYVDPGFLTGPLHYRGGILFFLIGLAVVIGIVKVMQRFERRTAAASSTKKVKHTAE